MSWSPDVFIGELRPWPDTVHVVRGKTDETRRYVPESGQLKAENAKLRGLLADLAICACGKYCYGCPHQYDGCDRDQRLRELGVEVDV